MANDSNNEKRQYILDTTLALVAEEDIKNTTISRISKRAQLSPGIIYYYFESKDEILHQIYADIEHAFISAAAQDDPFSLPILECYQHLWLNMYRFGLTHPRGIIFVEQYTHSAYYKDRISHAREEFLAKLQEKTRISIDNGEFKDLPIEAIYAIVVRPAIELTKLQLAGVDFLTHCTIEEIATSICGSLLKG
jgi:AcrR family transcriptional regulator